MDSVSSSPSNLPVTGFRSGVRSGYRAVFLGVGKAKFADLLGRTIGYLNTPFNDPDVGNTSEIEVTDPIHPLFGRRFAVISVSRALHSPGFVRVAYQGYMSLRIPIPATTLALHRPAVQSAKLTPAAITELVNLVVECEALPCLYDQPKSGSDCLPPSNLKLPLNSPPSSRR